MVRAFALQSGGGVFEPRRVIPKTLTMVLRNSQLGVQHKWEKSAGGCINYSVVLHSDQLYHRILTVSSTLKTQFKFKFKLLL